MKFEHWLTSEYAAIDRKYTTAVIVDALCRTVRDGSSGCRLGAARVHWNLCLCRQLVLWHFDGFDRAVLSRDRQTGATSLCPKRDQTAGDSVFELDLRELAPEAIRELVAVLLCQQGPLQIYVRGDLKPLTLSTGGDL